MSAHVFIVFHRRPLEPGRQKISVFRYAVVATTPDLAIDTVRNDNTHVSGGTWSARELEEPAIIDLGCYFEVATDEDRAARKAKRS